VYRVEQGPTVHTPLVDREGHVLGCIDRLRGNAELIRLDEGAHWFAVAHSSFAADEIALANELVHVVHSWIADIVPSELRLGNDGTSYPR
jgi:hypothetical protein